MSTELASKKPLESFYALIWRRYKKHRLAMISLIVLGVLGLLSLCAPILQKLLGVSPQVANLNEINLPYSWPHLLGTNELGQDIFLRLIYGGRISLSVGLIAALASSVLGTFVGLLAGFYGGVIDSALMRFTDAMLSIPVLPLMIVFAAIDLNQLSFIPNDMNAWYLALGIFAVYLTLRLLFDGRKKWQSSHYISKLIIDTVILTAILTALYIVIAQVFPWQSLHAGNAASIFKLIIIIVFFGWMGVARLSRASALQLRNAEFVKAAHALGASNARIILLHIFPNAIAPIVVAATLEVGENILYEAALSFLGLGIQPPLSSWGLMLNNAIEYLKVSPSLAFWPGFLILITVAAFNFLGDGMRDALDPYR